MIKYIGAALCALAAILVLKGQKSEFAGIVAFSAAVILFGFAVREFIPIIEYVNEIIEGTSFEKYLSSLSKALGITLAIQFSSDICKDAGEASIASKLELVGKAEILLISLPLIEELLSLVGTLMS